MVMTCFHDPIVGAAIVSHELLKSSLGLWGAHEDRNSTTLRESQMMEREYCIGVNLLLKNRKIWYFGTMYWCLDARTHYIERLSIEKMSIDVSIVIPSKILNLFFRMKLFLHFQWGLSRIPRKTDRYHRASYICQNSYGSMLEYHSQSEVVQHSDDQNAQRYGVLRISLRDHSHVLLAWRNSTHRFEAYSVFLLWVSHVHRGTEWITRVFATYSRSDHFQLPLFSHIIR